MASLAPAPFDRLLSATREAVRLAARNPAPQCPETAILDELLSQPVVPSAEGVEPVQTPTVAEHLDAAVQAVAGSPEGMLAEALAEAAPLLRWGRPYRTGEGADEFVAGYTTTILSMPGPPLREGYQAPFAIPRVLVAFSLQAPDLLYPLHRHKAPEIYHVISGVAQWRRDGEPWRPRLPGEWFFHATDQGHAMRTGKEPLLALAAWTDHLDCPPPVLEVDEPA